jgi:hypothetical protein
MLPDEQLDALAADPGDPDERGRPDCGAAPRARPVGATLDRSLTLVELGTSAGLLLHFARDAYRRRRGPVAGEGSGAASQPEPSAS